MIEIIIYNLTDVATRYVMSEKILRRNTNFKKFFIVCFYSCNYKFIEVMSDYANFGANLQRNSELSSPKGHGGIPEFLVKSRG